MFLAAATFNSNGTEDFYEPTFFEDLHTQLSLPVWTAYLKTSYTKASCIGFG
jgi:hypothetical protein